MNLDQARAHEISKYDQSYTKPNYAMGGPRRVEARKNLTYIYKAGRKNHVSSYLDIGCGRGEMLDEAKLIGFDEVLGTEAVLELTKRPDVVHMLAHNLAEIRAQRYDVVTSFDVLEHLIPGDDEILLREAGRIARHYVLLTANKYPSRHRPNGEELHINIRAYEEWHDIIQLNLGRRWKVERLVSRTPSATFLATSV